MRTFHVHIYKTSSVAEMDIQAKSSLDARIKALNIRKKLDYGKSDCKYVAFDYLKNK